MASKLNNIQGLRAYAALSVVFFHSGYLLPHILAFGFYGVDVFFVISGFIMAGICDLRPQKFFLRRAIRIIPLYWVATLAIFCLALARPMLLKATHPNVGQLVKSLLFIPFMKEDGLLQPLLFVGWSLNYEMYFYVLLALALLFVSGRRATFAVAAIVTVVPWLLLSLHSSSAIVKFYASPLPLEFAMGIGVYYVARAISIPTARKLRWPLLALSAFVVAELIVYFTVPLPYFPPDWVGFGIPSVVLVLTAALMSKCGWDLRAGWIILLGDASYAIYLLHPYILYFQERVLAKRWPVLSCEHNFFGMMLGVTLVCVISCAAYLYLEKPLVDWLARRYALTPRPTQAFLSEVPL